MGEGLVTIPRLPIFVIEGLDVSVYSSVDDAQRSLEPWWIKEDRGDVYDAEGRLMQGEAGRIRVTLSLSEEYPAHAEELENALRAYLRAIGSPAGNDQECKLLCLVDACSKIALADQRKGP